jgi:hypothetical protein
MSCLAGLPAAFGLRPAVFCVRPAVLRVERRDFGDRPDFFGGVIGFNATPEFEANSKWRSETPV